MKTTIRDRHDHGDLSGSVASTSREGLVELERRPTVEALSLFLRGRPLDAFESRLIDVLHQPVFRSREGLRAAEQTQLSYMRMRHLQRELHLKSSALLDDLSQMLALHSWTGLTDGTLVTLLTIHFNLCIGSIVQHGENRAELKPLLAELESMTSVGVFLATELAHGNNVQAMETEAIYDHAREEFVVHTPNVRAQKYMPNTGAEGVAKLGVVMARLRVADQDCGVFPFIVRIRTEDGLCPGVRVTALGEKPDYALDNAVTSFEHVRIPRSHWLSGSDSTIDEQGNFSSRVASRRVRFLRSMDRVQTGKLCLSAVGVAFCSAALQMTLRYAAQRRTFSPAGGDVSILSYRTYQRAVFESVATAYACALLVQDTQQVYTRTDSASEVEVNRALAMCKVFVSSRTVETLMRCRERVGAQGMFTANRIITWLVQSQGIVTAEGDNEVLLVKAARELLLGIDYKPPRADAERALVPMLESADFLVELVRTRERRLVHQLRAASGRSAEQGGLFDTWNDLLGDAVELASTHAVRLALDAFSRALDEVDEPSARSIVERLLRLFALQEIAKFSTAMIADGSLSTELAGSLQSERHRIAAELYADAETISDAFQIPSALLSAPIADDYMAAHDYLSDERRTLESYVRGLGGAQGSVG